MELITELLSDLRKKKIKLKLKGDNIEVVSFNKRIPSDLLVKIKSRKEDLVNYLKVNSERTFADIPRIAEAESYPLSSAQRRLWIASRFEKEISAYNIPMQLEFNGGFNLNNFKKAVDAVIERHEILRTVFKNEEDGKANQVVLSKEALDFEIELLDFRSEQDQEAKVKAYVEADSDKAFDLIQGPLLRASLLQLTDEHFVFYYNMHHIISDGWSMDVMAKDVMAYYEAFNSGRTPDLVPLKIQYKDYAVWQQNQLETAETQAHKAYWLQQLSDEIPLLDLPASKLRPRTKTYNGFSLRTYISTEDTTKLRGFVKEQGGSLFMAIVASMKVLLYKYTSEKDIVVGAPISGRTQHGLANQIGFYLSVLVLRNKILPESKFTDFYQQVKANILSAYQHQSYPFDQIIEDLELKYDNSRSPLADISITYNNIVDRDEYVAAEKIDKVEVLGNNKCKNDIEFHFDEINDLLSISVNYNRDVYDQEMIEGFLYDFKRLLHNLAEQPETLISKVRFMEDKEEFRLLETFNNNTVDLPTGKTVLHLFEEQAQKTPDQLALEYEGKKLTYKELDEITNQLAHHITEKWSVQSDDLIGMELERNEWMIISMLGILKSGAAYVPINPMLPNAVKQFIAEDTKLKLLITRSDFAFDIDYYDGDTFILDLEFEPENSKTEKINLAKPENLAYVIYTSGSTGKPKGVMVEHQSLLASTIARHTYYDDVNSVLPLLSFSFDASIGFIWNALTRGAAYHVVSDAVMKNPDKIVETLIANKVEAIAFPPSLYKRLINGENFKNAFLKRIVLGGERIPENLIKKHFELHPSCRLFNEYGPTENTVWTTVAEVDPDYSKAIIGKPIANNQVYVLDEGLQLTPTGVAGELYLGGANLSRGYLNLAEHEKEQFVSHPFKAGERLYKTGDFGKWLPDGTIEFLGRKDGQLKIRGFRIELSEIEYQLQSKVDISEVRVKVQSNETGEKELIAYLTAENEQSIEGLRGFLAERLPEYMIPECFVQLDKFPLTYNDKIDDAALSKQSGMVLLNEVEYVAPTNEKESLLVRLTESVLGIEQVGMLDNIFELGGNSLRLIDLIERLKREGYQVNIADIIQNPVLTEFIPLMKKVEQKEKVTS